MLERALGLIDGEAAARLKNHRKLKEVLA